MTGRAYEAPSPQCLADRASGVRKRGNPGLASVLPSPFIAGQRAGRRNLRLVRTLFVAKPPKPSTSTDEELDAWAGAFVEAFREAIGRPGGHTVVTKSCETARLLRHSRGDGTGNPL
jgi:hypothetical protein